MKPIVNNVNFYYLFLQYPAAAASQDQFAIQLHVLH